MRSQNSEGTTAARSPEAISRSTHYHSRRPQADRIYLYSRLGWPQSTSMLKRSRVFVLWIASCGSLPGRAERSLLTFETRRALAWNGVVNHSAGGPWNSEYNPSCRAGKSPTYNLHLILDSLAPMPVAEGVLEICKLIASTTGPKARRAAASQIQVSGRTSFIASRRQASSR
ncbi:hypothetical protein C8F01DRAFT_122475 [Mycena amicta]|nr:hypothetical protein C8F01DRAFT_122475 [Mycena amicta]